MKRGPLFKACLLLLFVLFRQTGDAQDHTRWACPKGRPGAWEKARS